MSLIWSTDDYSGRPVLLESIVFNEHIAVRHRDLAPHVQLLKNIVELPDFVLLDPVNSDTEIFCRYQALGETAGLYTNVCVGFQHGVGSVSTAFRSSTPKGSVPIYWKPAR